MSALILLTAYVSDRHGIFPDRRGLDGGFSIRHGSMLLGLGLSGIFLQSINQSINNSLYSGQPGQCIT